MGDYMKCCKYCKYYEAGICTNTNFSIIVESEVEDVLAEDFENYYINVGINNPESFYCNKWE